MRVSKWVALITVVLFGLSIIAGCGGGGTVDDADGAKKIRIGMITPLTGDVKTFGESVKDAFTLALEEADYKAGDWEIEVFIEDDRNIATEAVNVAEKLITQNKVSAIVGSVTSPCTISATEVAQANGVLMITPTSTAAEVTVSKTGDRKDFVFRSCFIDPLQGTIAANFALDELEAKTAAVLFDQGNDYTIGLKDYFKETFEEGGGKVLAAEAYTKNDTDFSAVLTRIAQQDPDVLYLPDYYQKASLIGKQARDRGIEAVFIGGDGWDSPELDFDALDGGYQTNHYSAEDPREEVQDWVSKYEAKYGQTPDAFGTLAYDATRLLLKAIEDADSDDPVAIRDAMAAITDFPAVSGNLSFDENGNPIKEVAILQIKDGTHKFVTTIAP